MDLHYLRTAVTEGGLGSSCGDSQILLSQFDPEQNQWSVNLTHSTRHVNLSLGQHYFYLQKSAGASLPVRQLFIHLQINLLSTLSLTPTALSRINEQSSHPDLSLSPSPPRLTVSVLRYTLLGTESVLLISQVIRDSLV